MAELYLPAEARVEILREYARRYDLKTFVETGTSVGFTTWALRNDFETIYTIETDRNLWDQAVQLFRDFPHIHCYCGDSAEVLPTILFGTHQPALFWLDGHWCAHGHNPDGPDTPIRVELPLVLGAPVAHVVLIDDARCFREGADWEAEQYDWPTLTWVRETAERYGYSYELTDDVIRLTPPIPYKYFGLAE